MGLRDVQRLGPSAQSRYARGHHPMIHFTWPIQAEHGRRLWGRKGHSRCQGERPLSGSKVVALLPTNRPCRLLGQVLRVASGDDGPYSRLGRRRKRAEQRNPRAAQSAQVRPRESGASTQSCVKSTFELCEIGISSHQPEPVIVLLTSYRAIAAPERRKPLSTTLVIASSRVLAHDRSLSRCPSPVGHAVSDDVYS
jgi:hypothetical protein